MPKVQVEDQASRAIYARLRHRARVLRGLAVGFVVLIALTLAFGTIPYFLAGSMAVTESRAALEMRRFEAEYAKNVEKRDRVAGETAGGAEVERSGPTAAAAGGAGGALAQAEARPAAAGAPAQADPRPAAAAPTSGPGPAAGLGVSDEAFSAAVFRITDVFVLVALVYVFGGLYRYSMRLASYYDEKADALRLLEAGDRQLEERLGQITVPNAAGTVARPRRAERV
jgi:hypothetical protein